MSPKFTAEQQVAANMARVSAATETTAAAAHGLLNAGIVLGLAWPAMMLGMASAMLQPWMRPPPR
jgi:hypothetical protein